MIGLILGVEDWGNGKLEQLENRAGGEGRSWVGAGLDLRVPRRSLRKSRERISRSGF